MVAHVVLDALFLDPGVSGGPETYLRGLAPALAAAAPATRFTVISSRRGARALSAAGWGDFATLESLPSDDDERVRKLIAQQVLLPRRAAALGADLVHSLSNLAPVRPSRPQVTTIFDVIYLEHRSMAAVSRLSIATVVRLGAPRASAIITLAGPARDAIVGALSIEPGRISVIPAGTGRDPGPATDPVLVRERYALPDGGLVLCVAAKRPHKNQQLLIAALAHLPRDVALVCVGRDDGHQAALSRCSRELGVADRVALLDYVPDQDLEGLYRLAACAALPTLAEGFGLPLLEAMRRGVPVACSDIPVLREVGDAAVRYFDPHDATSAAEAITACLDDGGVLADAARARAAEFSWESAAAATLEVYERCTSG